MNFVLLFLFVNIGYLLVSVAQPVMTNGVISNLDFDHDGSGELSYAVSAEFGGELPNRWTVGFGIEPYRTSRLLRSSDSKIDFSDGELIDQLRSIYKEVVVIGGDTTREFYALPILGYTATEKLQGLWEYKSIVDRFQTQQQILLGIRVPAASQPTRGRLRSRHGAWQP